MSVHALKHAPYWLCYALIVTSCSSFIDKPVERLSALIIENHSSSPITKVQLKVPETRSIVECGYIPRQRECSLGFSPRVNNNNPAVLYWNQLGQVFSKSLDSPEALERITDHPINIVIKVFDNGQVRVVKR